MQIVNVFLCRSADQSLVSTGLFGNPLILCGTILEVGLVASIDYTALGNAAFGTAPIGAEVWWLMVPFARAMILLKELRKWLARRRPGRSQLVQAGTSFERGAMAALPARTSIESAAVAPRRTSGSWRGHGRHTRVLVVRLRSLPTPPVASSRVARSLHWGGCRRCAQRSREEP
jgi:hypothetical protein